MNPPRLTGQIARPTPNGDVDLEELLRVGAGAALDAVGLARVGGVERGGAAAQAAE